MLYRCVDDCQYFGDLSLISVYVMGNDGVVVDAVSFFEQVSVLAVADFHSALHHHDEFFAFVRGEDELVIVRRSHVDDKRFHVAVGLRFGQGVVFHVFPALDCVVREADAVGCLRLAADGGSRLVPVVEEGAEVCLQYAGYLDEWCQRGQVDIVFDALNLFDGQAGAFCQFFAADVLAFAERFDFLAYNLACVHGKNVFRSV